jgi:hypothetical protein
VGVVLTNKTWGSTLIDVSKVECKACYNVQCAWNEDERQSRDSPALFLFLRQLKRDATVCRLSQYTYDPNDIVLQIHSPGWRSDPQPADILPEVTLWGDGRVIFGASDGSLQEGRLSAAEVERLVEAATVVYTLSERYEDLQGSDLPTRVYSVQTSLGERSVTVIGLNLDEGPPDEPHRVDMEKLRQLRRTVREALPKAGQPPKADRVLVHFWSTEPTGPSQGDWPPELDGLLTGDAAQKAADLSPVGQRTVFRVGGKEVWKESVLTAPGHVLALRAVIDHG